MNVSGIASGYNTCGYSAKAAGNTEMSFAESIEAAEKSRDSFSFSRGGEKSPEDMTSEEYRAYIYCRISAMKKGSSKYSDTLAVISDEGYKAMQNDPEYERWVLCRLKEAFSRQPRGFSKDKDVVHTAIFIGASEEETRCESWSSGDFKGPSAEELRRFRLSRRMKAEKLRKYRKALEDNSIEKAEKERDHIKGIYMDNLHIQKNISAQLNINKLYYRQS